MTDAIDIATLESHLWDAANILRGSPLDRTDWKAYLLPLLFYKRLCDVYDEETTEALQRYGDADFGDFPEAHRFQLPEAAHSLARGKHRNRSNRTFGDDGWQHTVGRGSDAGSRRGRSGAGARGSLRPGHGR